MARDRRRLTKLRKVRPTRILVTEGATELHYFSGLKQTLAGARVQGLPRPGIRIHDAGGISPLHVVETAIKLFDKFGPPDRHTKYFAIFDTEYPDISKRQSLDKAIRLAMKCNVAVVVSNPCFEVWLHCHLEDFSPRKFQNSDDCVTVLGGEWRKHRICKDGYTKADATVFDRVKGQLPHAIDRARYLRETHHQTITHTADANAATDAYRIVEYLQGITSSYMPFEATSNLDK